MRLLSLICVLLSFSLVHAADKIKMNFNNEELTKVIETYAKASGQKFIIDPAVRGKITMLLPEPITVEEAFNQLSSALAVNGVGISKQGDTMVIKNARNIQRDLIEVGSEKPNLKPERMYTWIYSLKNRSADSINRELRMLTSKDGEMTTLAATNQLIICDWASNLQRIGEILKEVDKPVSTATAKVAASGKMKKETARATSKESEEAAPTKAEN